MKVSDNLKLVFVSEDQKAQWCLDYEEKSQYPPDLGDREIDFNHNRIRIKIQNT